jgi:hypothetical protein
VGIADMSEGREGRMAESRTLWDTLHTVDIP